VLTTEQKMFLARVTQSAVMFWRSILHRSPIARVRRSGLNWELDLREGIDFSIWLLGSFEPTTVAAYSRYLRPGQVVLDIGANIGAHTLPMARLVGDAGKVVSFEPTSYAYGKLCDNVSANSKLANRIQCVQAMLIDSDLGQVPDQLYSSWPLGREQDVHELHLGKLMSTEGARAATLDTLVGELGPERVDFIKLDIDGFEPRMFRGATQVLQRWRPTIIMELAPYVLKEEGSSLAELIEILAANSYSLWQLDGVTKLPMDYAELDGIIPRGSSLNVIAMVGRSDV